MSALLPLVSILWWLQRGFLIMQELNSFITQEITVSFGSIFEVGICCFLIGFYLGSSRYQSIEFVLRQKIVHLHQQLLALAPFDYLHEHNNEYCENCAHCKNCYALSTDKLYQRNGEVIHCFKYRRSIIRLIKEKVGKFNAKSNTDKE